MDKDILETKTVFDTSKLTVGRAVRVVNTKAGDGKLWYGIIEDSSPTVLHLVSCRQPNNILVDKITKHIIFLEDLDDDIKGGYVIEILE